ncbi:helix-turn-helix domain-containing protein [Noviherbaspirillum cavernae]|uniref:Helix-turn-helix domain-containing protein n=1 Tax=Noviherbaspirillum cavernae TaxID=2320862 RepID=A0A418X020_9BURK|nr:helix-turn-helix domain-containing protein [Noviherbaspirillum cavernae]RJG05665.1 helix-turn-helix domain-containing protein [Noviherbaspirillum cavernae]
MKEIVINKKYVVKLTAEERARYEHLVHTGKSAAWKIQRAQALLKADQGAQGPGWDDARIAEAFGVTTRSLQNWRKQAVEEGPDSLLEHQWAPRPRAVKLDGEGQARLTALACSTAPDGRASWTLNLLANKLVELHIVDTISRETVRQALKKAT